MNISPNTAPKAALSSISKLILKPGLASSLERLSETSRRESFDGIIKRQKDFYEGKTLNKIVVFPEGTTSNNNYIVKFKRGVFKSLLPLKPIMMNIDKNAPFHLCSNVTNLFFHVMRSFTCLKNKIFYYSSNERVDFRELIKILADKFHIRIEMKQIGVRQEAARLGGLGSCGREICCASWLNNFQSVATSTARTQQLSLNPQKLAGQCGKLKCCINFENEAYQEELKKFPNIHTIIHTEKGDATCNKIDIFKNLMWYSYKNDTNHMFYAIPTDKVKQLIAMNAAKQTISGLEEYAEINQGKTTEDTNFNIDDLKEINN